MPHHVLRRFSLETLLESTTDAVGAVDADLRTIFANDAFSVLFRKTAGHELALGAPITERWEEPARGRYEALYRRALGGESFVVELELPAAGGRPLTLNIRLSPIRGPDGVVGVVTIARDVSQQRQAESTLRSIARGVAETTGSTFFQALVARLTEALDVQLAFVGRLVPGEVEVVRAVAVQHGSAPGDDFDLRITGTRCEQILREPTAPHFFSECVEDCFPRDFESCGGIALVDSTGKPSGVLAVAATRPLVDTEGISAVLRIFAARAAAELERLTQQEALERSRAGLATLLEYLPHAVGSTDPKLRLLTFNGRFSQLLTGLTGRPVTAGLPLEHWLEAERWERWHGMFERAARRGHAFLHDRVRGSGGEQLLNLMVNAIRHGDELSGFVVHAQDVTARAALDTELRRNERLEATARLAGGIAHDFNNVLAMIQATARNELAELREDDPLRPSFADISAACESAGRLTRELFALARQQDVRLSTLDVRSVAEALAPVLQRIAGTKTDLQLELGDAPALARGDQSQLERVLVNLVTNARDALPGGGRIEVSVRRCVLDAEASACLPGTLPGSWVELRVTDTGTGIPPELVPHLFEPFFTTKAAGKGTGLGLASTYGIVRQLGGCIAVESELGRGTTFRVLLQEGDADLARAQAPEPSGPAPADEALTVLVVDDDPAVRSLVGVMLKKSGFHVLAAADHDEALRLVSSHGEAQVLLTEVVSPRMSGLEVEEAVRIRCPALETLYMSGYAADVLSSSGFDSRNLAFIAKPFAAHELVMRVREAAARQQARARERVR